MIIVSKKHYQIPLQGKIILAGSRISTAKQPKFSINNGQLLLSDQWLIQLIDSVRPRGAEPQLLEFPLDWEETLPWDLKQSDNITVNYQKKPQIKEVQTKIINNINPVLDITVEVPIAIELELTDQQAQAIQTANTIPLSSPPHKTAKQVPTANPVPQPSYQELESKCRELTTAVEELQQRLLSLEEKSSEQTRFIKFSGYVVDSFRLSPIIKAIIELTPSNKADTTYKLVSDNQGYFSSEELEPGTYDIKVKHPRYHPLSLNNYVFTIGEEKSQDFILKRI